MKWTKENLQNKKPLPCAGGAETDGLYVYPSLISMYVLPSNGAVTENSITALPSYG